ncbi:MucBP domain-containing protein [Erysipelothrix rhusiopathiae]|uniref:MucBP domain-containing protein n=1 Tax=Erysipelothrix rhusiopathiae TaxID=1648 RepID=UPI0023B07D18|nr:MucBP domain-containing protein [Erysipelothrix rhusiopathiae]MDE8256165.1 MucBP domain-containing protein [Erysipelothrix rhusiopathiae]
MDNKLKGVIVLLFIFAQVTTLVAADTKPDTFDEPVEINETVSQNEVIEEKTDIDEVNINDDQPQQIEKDTVETTVSKPLDTENKESPVVTFTDPVMEDIIRIYTGIQIGTPITEKDMLRVVALDKNVWGRINNIKQWKNFEGLQYAKNLKVIDIAGYTDSLEDISAIKGLSVSHLNINGNEKITDISSIMGMPLQKLEINELDNLGDNTIEVLNSLTELNYVEVGCSKITDYTWVEGKPLKTFKSGANNLKNDDLKPLGTLKELDDVYLASNPLLTHLDVFENMNITESLNMNHTGIQDLSELKKLNGEVKHITLTGNGIEDLSPLADFTQKNIEMMTLGNNRIYDYSPLVYILENENTILYLGEQRTDLDPFSRNDENHYITNNPVIAVDGKKVEAYSNTESFKLENLEDNTKIKVTYGINNTTANDVMFSIWYKDKKLTQISAKAIKQPQLRINYKVGTWSQVDGPYYREIIEQEIHPLVMGEKYDFTDYIKTRKSDKLVGYELLEKTITDNVKGIAENDVVVDVAYTKIIPKYGYVYVEYKNQDGDTILESQRKDGVQGTSYDVSPLKTTINGYTFKSVKGTEKGIFTDKAQTITYVYSKDAIKAENVTVRFEDEAGIAISKDSILEGNVGDSYDTTLLQTDFTGYTFKSVKGTEKGIFTDKVQTVTYIYKKNVVHGADLTILYHDAFGNEIAEAISLKGIFGESYAINLEEKLLKIPGYTYSKYKGELKGTFSHQAYTLILIYIKDEITQGSVEIQYQDSEGKLLHKTEIVEGVVGDAYNVEERKIEIPGYTFKNIIGDLIGTYGNEAIKIVYIYEKDPIITSFVTVHYIDEAGNAIAPVFINEGVHKESFALELEIIQKTIEGYEFNRIEGDMVGNYINGNIDVYLVYEVVASKDAPIKDPSEKPETNPNKNGIIKQPRKGEKINTEKVVNPKIETSKKGTPKYLPSTGASQNYYLAGSLVIIGILIHVRRKED